MVLLDTGIPGTSREIYSEDADGETQTCNLSVINQRKTWEVCRFISFLFAGFLLGFFSGGAEKIFLGGAPSTFFGANDSGGQNFF